MVMNNQRLNQEIFISNSRDRFIIMINIYFNMAIIFSCEISKLGFDNISGK